MKREVLKLDEMTKELHHTIGELDSEVTTFDTRNKELGAEVVEFDKVNLSLKQEVSVLIFFFFCFSLTTLLKSNRERDSSRSNHVLILSMPAIIFYLSFFDQNRLNSRAFARIECIEIANA